MKINWKTRRQSGPFWAGAASAFLMFLYALSRLLGYEPGVTMEETYNMVMLFLAFMAAIGAISDPTTPGFNDSDRALRYSVPGGTSADNSLE